MTTMLRALAALLLAALVAGCGALGTFDALVPKDGGSMLAARDVAYGPEPRQRLDVYRPASGRENGAVVVFAYGGAWTSGRKDEFSFVGRAFASRGYVTVLFDRRLAPGVRYPLFVEDTAAAVAWARAHAGDYGADGRRLFLVGHSSGAYDVMMVALAPEFLRAQGLSPASVRAVVGLSGPYDFLPLDDPASIAAFGGVPDLPSTQPVNRARGGGGARPPVLVIHGEDDERVHPRHSRALAEALRLAGRPVEERYYPGVDHADTVLSIARPLRGRAPVLEDVLAFLRRHDRARRQPGS